jgi:phage gpG-like protein
VRIVLEISGDKQLSRDLLRVGDRAVHAKPALEEIADYWMRLTTLQFDTEGRHASGGWKPLKEETVRRKQLANLDPRILRATGALFGSLTSRGDGNQILDVTETELAYGSRLPYAGAHQNPRPGSRLPQRRPVELTESARRETVKILQRHIFAGRSA